jgi:hypothetical protein
LEQTATTARQRVPYLSSPVAASQLVSTAPSTYKDTVVAGLHLQAAAVLNVRQLVNIVLDSSLLMDFSSKPYYLVILDDFTHYLWTFPLKLKSDTFTTLSNFFSYVSNQFGNKIKAIQCDNGHEFDNSSTRIFLLSSGTQLRMSCPYTSPQNGKAERIIRSINNVIRTLLIQTSFLGRYWAEGLHTTTYLLNRLPTKAI